MGVIWCIVFLSVLLTHAYFYTHVSLLGMDHVSIAEHVFSISFADTFDFVIEWFMF